MARRVRNPKLDSRSARLKLAKRREPYWAVISGGCALGYRRGAQSGTWIAKLRAEDGKRHYEPLGAADDVRDPDGLTVFSFAHAQERARAFFNEKARALAGMAAPSNGPYTVNRALDEYFAERERRGSKSARIDRYSANARIRTTIGDVEVRKLTTPRIRQWQAELEKAPKLRRTAKGAAKRKTAAVNPKDPDAVRARKASANRVLTILKAALTFAYQEGKVVADDAWRKIKPAREVDAPLIQFLAPAECVRLVNACQGAFRDLVRGALVTGCRYGELCRLRAGDFSREAGTVTIRQSKSGKRRHVALNDEGRQLFSTMTAGKTRGDLVFVRDDGHAWGASHQQRPLDEASRIAKLDPPATFHILRHTYASALAAKAVPMRVIADQLGHADTRITERHYAHLSPSHVADVVRAALPGFGIIEQSNIAALDR
ncbi:MAG: tyrosine-type recombinase/integrase [Methylovirgula sp.]